MSTSSEIQLSSVNKRRTFAIISHPDAGKTTLTEKLLWFGGAIQMAGTVKARKSSHYATSDWMEMEKQRGISVTTSVMQFIHKDHIINLLDTPGHADFSEDTYRTLTAVDSALMVIDAAKGVEERTIKLMNVCRLRDTPIMTFINKLDREGRPPIELLDEIEKILKIRCTPITWPIGMGQRFKGVYHLLQDRIYLYKSSEVIEGLSHPLVDEKLGELASEFREEIELVKGASSEWCLDDYRKGVLSPVYFGTAIHHFGVKEWLDDFVDYAPSPQPRLAHTADGDREVIPVEEKFSGFVFKIQANMDPNHRDRVAFLRICSGKYERGMKVRHLRIGKDIQLNQALTFMAGDRENTEEAWPGDIIGLHNHGTIQIGDTFSQGEQLKFSGIPYFAPELFRLVRLKDPLKSKALLKGLTQLSEEGATQVFKPLNSNQLILGAVGLLQFDVVAFRLKNEYNVDCIYENVNVAAARWVSCEDSKGLEKFKLKVSDGLALDGADQLVYLAPTHVNLRLTEERYPEIIFRNTREH